jgi:hypothetical protein
MDEVVERECRLMNAECRIKIGLRSAFCIHHSALARVACITILLLLPACQSSTPPSVPVKPPAPVTPPVSTAAPVFQNPTAGVAFDYPSGWAPHAKGKEIIFSVSSGPSVLTLAYPKLPWHIPNLIPIDSVRSGYADDIKSKQITGAVETDLGAANIPDATATRVKLAGRVNGKPAVDEAVLIVHADHVYILSIRSDDADYNAARAALDEAVKSLRWIK